MTRPRTRDRGRVFSFSRTGADAASSLDEFLAGSESVAAALVARDGRILDRNRALERLTGQSSSIHEVVVPAQGDIVIDLIAGAGPSWHSGQAGLVRPGGDPVDCKLWAVRRGEHVLLLAEELRTQEEKLTALLLELNDDLLRARRELGDQNRRLRELHELKDMFLRSSGHDLQQPLTAIIGYAEMLGEEGLPEEARRSALVIEKNARRVTAMINDLVGAASVLTGELELVRSRVDVVDLVRAAVDGILPAARAGAVTVTRSGVEAAEAWVDERRVLQILDNLLSNAVKYCPGGGEVGVHCEVEGHIITIAVTDTGIGIPAAEQHQVFDRYFRASTAVGDGITGTGLGLANARAFTQAHGGSLTCSSEPGTGSTFTLALPDGLETA